MQLPSQGWRGLGRAGPCRATSSCKTYTRCRPPAVFGLREAAGPGCLGSHSRGSSLGGRGRGKRWTATHSQYVHPTETVDYEAGIPDFEPAGEAKDDDEVDCWQHLVF